MTLYTTERVLFIHHWNETLFSFRTTRDPTLRFENGQFVMLGLEVEGKPLVRAYSLASANYDEYLEFFSIKIPNGPLTSRLQHLKPGDSVMVSRKPTGTLTLNDVLPGKHLYLLATGTGLAPFLSLIKDPNTYERFEQVILVHGVRYKSELAYSDYLENELPNHEWLGDWVTQQLIYYASVTREPFKHNGRLTELVPNGQLQQEVGLPPLDPNKDRLMLCGNADMLHALTSSLNTLGFKMSPRIGIAGDFVIERAFVEK